MPTFIPEFGGSKFNIFGNVGPGTRICSGTFQATAAAVTTVSNANIPASANILFDPANAAAGLLLRTKTASIATGNSAGSFVFTISATGAGAPSGSETFNYWVSVVNP